MYLQSLVFTVEIILPVFLLVVLGYFLRQRNIIDEHFIHIGSRLVFTLTLPVLVFLAIANMHLDAGMHVSLAIFVAVAILATTVVSVWWARFFGIAHEDKGSFVQAAFRSNLGILGISLAVYAFGEPGTEVAALVLAVGVPMYNLLSVLALAHGKGVNWNQQLWLIAKNPLIISIVLALPFTLFQWQLPSTVESAARSLGNMTLPLALLGIGGTLDFAAMKKANSVTLQIVLLKLVVLPGLVCLAAIALGFRGVELGVIVIMLASPTAAAAFVMARSMGGNHVLTANAIALSTLGSLITIGAYFYVLRVLTLV